MNSQSYGYLQIALNFYSKYCICNEKGRRHGIHLTEFRNSYKVIGMYFRPAWMQGVN